MEILFTLDLPASNHEGPAFIILYWRVAHDRIFPDRCSNYIHNLIFA